mmetsp:Transcript_8371/g.13542  ORF Transcript_8371/g.13542 Transcript_8371/m.13542 type:complete len:134 (-) Transcript_8371:479-880(-)|eukprot:CAMPEP_0196192484 /NCGR_PEP_ID=MMETSP0911-20130528/49043_1 /TAXON_ID=49265 /ORGANISM="Thalassiosira rotula, Strain GSO102" /LENGTH=133 /DNA_ID=CAMNT_0041464673 /DNA_START=29 /DNA_END=430 /DNA_ORIENTATION=+
MTFYFLKFVRLDGAGTTPPPPPAALSPLRRSKPSCLDLSRRRRSDRLPLSAVVVEAEDRNLLSLSKPALPLLVHHTESSFNLGLTLALDDGVPLLSLAEYGPDGGLLVESKDTRRFVLAQLLPWKRRLHGFFS